MCCLIVTQEHTAVFAASEHRLSSERAESGVSGDASMSRHARFASVSRHARPCHSLLAARAAAMATAEQWRSLCRQAMPVGEACAQCVCPSWRWRCTMQRFKLSVETPSAADSFFCASHVRFPGVGDVSKTRWEAWEQFGRGLVWNKAGGPSPPTTCAGARRRRRRWRSSAFPRTPHHGV